MRHDPGATFIDLLRLIARRGGRLILNGLAARANAVGGMAPQRVSPAPRPRQGR